MKKLPLATLYLEKAQPREHQVNDCEWRPVRRKPARTSKTIIKLSDLYADRIETARLRAGNMFADPLIAADFGTCKGLLQKL